MNPVSVNQIAEEIVRHHEERKLVPETHAPYKINLEHYRSRDQFAAERRMFHDSWLMMGFSVDLPQAGSVKTNDFLDIPILLVRTAAGAVKAFVNSCRHRGGKLVNGDECQQRKNLVCPYHGWVYGLDGVLKGVEKEYLFGPLQKDAHGLKELPCEERHGMIFVRATPGESMSVEDYIGEELSAELAEWDFSQLHFVDSTTIETNSNWKVQMDTFLENYHVEALHKSTIGGLALSGWEHVKNYGRHRRMAFAQRSISTFLDTPPAERAGHKHLSFVYNIFPNIFIVYGYLWVQYFELYPGRNIDEQKTRFSLYCRKPMVTSEHQESARKYFDLNMEFVPVEDYAMGEQVTRSIFANVEKYHLFGHGEKALFDFHWHLRARLGLDPEDLIYQD